MDQELSLEQGLADETEVEVLQVAQPAVDHLRGAARGPLGEVVALDQRHGVAARSGVERHAGAGDPPPITITSNSSAASPRAPGRGRSPPPSLEELDHLVGRGALGHPLLLDRGAQVEQADEALVLGILLPPPGPRGPQHLGRAPVGGEAAGVAGEQDDVCRAGGGVQVLFVLDRIPGERAGADDERRGAVELRGGLGPAASFSRSSARGRSPGSATDW